MTDPAVAYLPGEGYGPFDRGVQDDIWLKAANGSSYSLGAVWPGVTVFPGRNPSISLGILSDHPLDRLVQ